MQSAPDGESLVAQTTKVPSMHSVTPSSERGKRGVLMPGLNKTFTANYAEYLGDESSPCKKLSAFFALRHVDDFRYSPGLKRWLYWHGGRWRACTDEHVKAAEQICTEAAKVLWRWHATHIDAAARELIRLAQFEPCLTAGVPEHKLSDELKAWKRGLQ